MLIRNVRITEYIAPTLNVGLPPLIKPNAGASDVASLPLSTKFTAVMLFGAGLTIAASGPAAAQAVTCQALGTKTICSDGSSYQMSGGKIVRSDGTTFQRIGKVTTGSDGSTYRTSGDVTVGSNGSICRQAGNVIACN